MLTTHCSTRSSFSRGTPVAVPESSTPRKKVPPSAFAKATRPAATLSRSGPQNPSSLEVDALELRAAVLASEELAEDFVGGREHCCALLLEKVGLGNGRSQFAGCCATFEDGRDRGRRPSGLPRRESRRTGDRGPQWTRARLGPDRERTGQRDGRGAPFRAFAGSSSGAPALRVLWAREWSSGSRRASRTSTGPRWIG